MKVFQRKSQQKGKICTYQLCNKDLFQWIEYYVINATLSVNPLNLAQYSHSLALCVYVSLRTQNVLSFTHSCDTNSIKTYKQTTNSCECSVLVQSPSNLVSGHRGAENLKLQILCQSKENHKKSCCLVWMCECVSQSVSIKNSLTLFYHEKKNIFKHIDIVLQLMPIFFDDVYNVKFHWFCCPKIVYCELYWNWFDS